MHMIQDLGLKASTVQSVHSILYQMFESAVMDSLVRINPTANVLKSLRKMLSVEQEKRHALTEEEQTMLLSLYITKNLLPTWPVVYCPPWNRNADRRSDWAQMV